jgi:hypothetical protein
MFKSFEFCLPTKFDAVPDRPGLAPRDQVRRLPAAAHLMKAASISSNGAEAIGDVRRTTLVCNHTYCARNRTVNSAQHRERVMDITALLPNLIFWAAIVGSLLIIGTTIMGGIAFYKGKETADAFATIIQHGNMLQMLAVALIIVAVIGLALLDKINAEAVVSILSGIAGYVLGGVTGRMGARHAGAGK